MAKQDHHFHFILRVRQILDRILPASMYRNCLLETYMFAVAHSFLIIARPNNPNPKFQFIYPPKLLTPRVPPLSSLTDVICTSFRHLLDSICLSGGRKVNWECLARHAVSSSASISISDRHRWIHTLTVNSSPACKANNCKGSVGDALVLIVSPD